MKKFDKIIAIIAGAFLLTSIIMPVLFQSTNNGEDAEYKVEINEIYLGLVESGTFTRPDLSSCKYIKSVDFLPEEAQNSQGTSKQFYKSINGIEYEIKPFF